MDVVYPYKGTPDDFEMRYSLRSLVNLPHDRVIIAGDRPAITSGFVEHIDAPRISDRFQSSTANLLAAVNLAGVPGDFVLMHDDMFILEPWSFKHEHRGTIDEYLRKGGPTGDYRRRTEETRDILRAHGVDEPLFFGLHTPTIYNGKRLIEVTKEFEGQGYLLRTLYHNLFPQPCERQDDVKVRWWVGDEVVGGVVSTTDQCADFPEFREWIAALFPERSRYEIAGPCLILGYAPSVWAEAELALAKKPYPSVIASPEAAAHWPGEVLAIASDDDHAVRIAALHGFNEVVFCGRSEATA